MARPTRTRGELIEASEHLQYEVRMLFSTQKALTSGVSDEVLQNALLESFTIHVRALLAFLYDDRPQEGDVIADDFVSGWSSKRPPKPKLLEKARRRVGKEIAHLTYDRLSVREEAKLWRHRDIAVEIFHVFVKFVQLVPNNLLGPKMAAQKVEILGTTRAEQ